MKNQNRIHRNGARRSAPVQAKIKSPAAPAEFKIVRLRECPIDRPKIDTTADVVRFWRKQVVTAPWFKDEKECLCVFLLDTRHMLLGFELVSQGTLDTVLMHPREVLRPATVHNAAAVIVAHNHPSGDPTPSDPDVQAMRELIQAARVLKIDLLDSVIVGDARRDNSFTSLRALGYFESERATAPAERTAPGQAEAWPAQTKIDFMKSNRFRSNGVTIRNPGQQKTAAQRREVKPLAEPGINESGSYTGREPICLTIFDHRTESDLAGCDITPAQLSALQRRAKVIGEPVGYLLGRAVQALVAP